MVRVCYSDTEQNSDADGYGDGGRDEEIVTNKYAKVTAGEMFTKTIDNIFQWSIRDFFSLPLLSYSLLLVSYDNINDKQKYLW